MENPEPIAATISHPLTKSTSALQIASPSGHQVQQVPLQNVVVHPSIILSDETSSSEFSDFELESQTTLGGCVGNDGRFQPLALPPNFFTNQKLFKSNLPNPSTPGSSCHASSSASSQRSLLAVKTVHSERQNYWKINFFLILLPLIVCGLPVHLLLGGRRRISGTKEWLKQIFLKDPICIRIITVCFFLFGLGVNGLFIYIAGGLLYSLTIKGEVRSSIFEDVINIVRVAPVVIPIDIIWICGYSVRKLLISFDRVTYPEIEVEWKIDYGKMSKKKKKPDKAWKNGWRSMTSYRIRLVAVYFIVIFNQLVHALITFETTKDVTDSSRIFDTWVSFALNFMYNLMLPIHMCLAWAIDWEFQRLSLYIKSLIACKIHPTFEYLAQFKKYYKSVGNHVMSVNDICGGYYSWVLLYLFLSMYNEVYGVIQVIITSFISYILGTVSNGTDLPKANVRLFVGNVFGGFSQVLLIALTG